MQMTIAGIQSDAVWWLQETALRVYRPNTSDFVHALHKVCCANKFSISFCREIFVSCAYELHSYF